MADAIVVTFSMYQQHNIALWSHLVATNLINLRILNYPVMYIK